MAELTQMKIVSLEDLEAQLGVRKWPRFIEQCEATFERRLMQIANAIRKKEKVKAIFISGPTASGKTTFTHRLAEALRRMGKSTHILSLDDYYLTTTIEYDHNGRPDFESIHNLDTAQMVEDFRNLLAGEIVQLPTFDFVRRCRVHLPEKKVQLRDQDMILIEGLHGLSKDVAGHFSHGEYYGVFIMPWCTLLDGKQLLGSRDLRILRRISRDVLHRGSTALSTLDYWPMIDHTEQRFFPPYLARADAYINSSLPYEFSVIAPSAMKHLRKSLRHFEKGTLQGSIYRIDQDGYADLNKAVDDARQLIRACERIPRTDKKLVPPQSILNEFIH